MPLECERVALRAMKSTWQRGIYSRAIRSNPTIDAAMIRMRQEPDLAASASKVIKEVL